MQQTEHYGLNQWDPTDRILREDFNADNLKIAQALAGKAPARKLLHMSSISGLTNGTGIRFTSFNPDWNQWEFVILLAEMKLTHDDPSDKMSLITLPDAKIMVDFQAGPFLTLFLPKKNGGRSLSGFILGNSCTCFSSALTYNQLTQLDVNISGSSSAHKMQDIFFTLYGIA